MDDQPIVPAMTQDVGPSRAQRWANYPGDTTHMLGKVYGPNTMGEALTAVEATYDPQADTTRVGFVYGTPKKEN